MSFCILFNLFWEVLAHSANIQEQKSQIGLIISIFTFMYGAFSDIIGKKTMMQFYMLVTFIRNSFEQWITLECHLVFIFQRSIKYLCFDFFDTVWVFTWLLGISILFLLFWWKLQCYVRCCFRSCYRSNSNQYASRRHNSHGDVNLYGWERFFNAIIFLFIKAIYRRFTLSTP